ncbi:MAG: CHAT domain-containing tetratricopeptide repeat protein [Cyanobacteria bacterium P01_A01_bin.123]
MVSFFLRFFCNTVRNTGEKSRWIHSLLVGILTAIAPLPALASQSIVPRISNESPITLTAPLISPPFIAQGNFGSNEADRLRMQGIEQANQNNYEAALSLLEQALAAYRDSGNSLGEGFTLIDLGQVYRFLGQATQARDRYTQALTLAETLGNPRLEADSLNNLGVIANDISDYEASLDYLEQALALNRTLNEPGKTAEVLANLGSTHQSLGDYQSAIQVIEEALTLFRSQNDLATEAHTLTQLGLIYVRLGEYPQALTQLQSALEKRRTVGDRSGEAVTLNIFCLTYYRLGQYERALDHCQQSVAILQSVGNRFDQGYPLNNIGGIQESLEQYAAAQQSYEEALAIHRETGDRGGEATTLNNLGSVFYNQQQDDQALPYYTAALELFQATGFRFGEARSLNNIALIYARREQYDDAIALYNQALDIFQTLEDPQGEARIRRNLALISAQQNRLDEAESQLRRSLVLLDQVRAADLSDAEKIALLETQQNIYRTLEQVLVLADRPEDALVASEQGRTRAFADLIAANLSEQLATEVELVPPDVAQIRQIAHTQNATLVEYSLAEDDLSDPALHIWVVQPDGDIAFRSVSLQALAPNQTRAATRAPDTWLNALVESVRLDVGGRGVGVVANVAGNSPQGDDAAIYQQLHQLLIAPIAEFLPDDPGDRVIFIPRDSLFLVPFAALQNPSGEVLIEHHTLSTVPSIQVLGLTQQLSQHDSTTLANVNPAEFLVVGNPTMPQVWSPETNSLTPLPPLPGAQQEAEAIASLFNLQALIGNQATESQVKQQATDATVIHLATHGLLEYGQVAASGVQDLPGAIALTPGNGDDGLLTAAEILQLDLQADLVVLSACDTGLGRIVGDGVVGLSRSLVAAGVPSVVVSLWSVPDAPTAELMTEFYQQLSQGQDKAQALRQAMLITRDRYPHPRDWAAFTLMGETN